MYHKTGDHGGHTTSRRHDANFVDRARHCKAFCGRALYCGERFCEESTEALRVRGAAQPHPRHKRRETKAESRPRAIFFMAIIDVAIPNYQQGRYLEQCVRSVQAQTLTDFRILIIDNASTDSSIEVAERLAAKDGRVSIIRHARNLGHIASFNEGIDWAAAKYFLLLCSDDILTPSAMGRAVAAMENDEEISFCFGDYRILRDGDRLRHPADQAGLTSRGASTPGAVYPREMPIANILQRQLSDGPNQGAEMCRPLPFEPAAQCRSRYDAAPRPARVCGRDFRDARLSARAWRQRLERILERPAALAEVYSGRVRRVLPA